MTDHDEEFSDFMAARWVALHRFAYLLCGDPQAAEDLAQAALVKAYAAWGRIQAKNAAEAYVRKTILRLFLNQRRARRFATGLFTEHAGPNYAMGDAVEDRSIVWEAVRALPPRQRAVVILRYYEDLSEASIAEHLGCRTGTVKSTSAKALASLRAGLPAEVTNGRQS